MHRARSKKWHMRLYLRISVGEKTKLLVFVTLFSILIISAISLYFLNLSTKDTGQILTQISHCERVQDKLEKEESALRTYLDEETDENAEALDTACTQTSAALADLPYDVTQIGEERYARTWNLKNAYESYAAEREALIERGQNTLQVVQEQYRLYDSLDYLDSYARNLTQLTVEAGSSRFDNVHPILQSLPYILLLISAALLIAESSIARELASTVVEPVTRLAREARRMAEGDYSGEDIVVENEDEIGDLVRSFNAMKKATKDNIETLEEKRRLEKQLRREEAQKAELTHRLETTRLDLLQSQINPHFLFNTLGSIASMAEIEGAETTGKMIVALSNIFRYNLRTTDSFTALSGELQNARDYLYLQKMRFGERVQYDFLVEPDVDPDRVEVPVFLLQPVIENAVKHGIEKKEEGGRIVLRIRERGQKLIIEVADTGVGIPKEKLTKIYTELASGKTGQEVHIGVGNVYQRIKSLYPDGDMRIESTENVGTTVTMVIPQQTTQKGVSDGNEEKGNRIGG